MAVKKSQYLIAFVCLSAIILFAANLKQEEKILGVWLVGNGKAKVEIEKIGKKYVGKIVWLKNPKDANGAIRTDKNNPDEKLRKNPLVGISLLKDFVYDGENEWKDGSIYDPENGKTYSCNMTLKDTNTLEVRGYVGLSMFGRTDLWKKTE
jgi:uncharacterized protein (DUF2147 family)